MIEDIPGWVRITGVVVAVLLIPAICLVGWLFERVRLWRDRRIRWRWRRG